MSGFPGLWRPARADPQDRYPAPTKRPCLGPLATTHARRSVSQPVPARYADQAAAAASLLVKGGVAGGGAAAAPGGGGGGKPGAAAAPVYRRIPLPGGLAQSHWFL
jgi:hypothetical protein